MIKEKVYGDSYHLLVASHIYRDWLGERAFNDDYEEWFEFIQDKYNSWLKWDEKRNIDEPWNESFKLFIRLSSNQ